MTRALAIAAFPLLLGTIEVPVFVTARLVGGVELSVEENWEHITAIRVTARHVNPDEVVVTLNGEIIDIEPEYWALVDPPGRLLARK